MKKGKFMRPFRAPRLIVKETEEGNLESSPDKSDNTVREKHLVPEPETQNVDAASPNVLEFELYLDGLASKGDSTMASSCKVVPEKNLVSELESQNVLESEFYLDGLASKGESTMSKLPLTKPAHMSNDDWWETVLQSEQQRFKARDEVLNAEAVSSDDDLPIVQTLPVARKKKKVKSLWSYETVMEPTGARSKYWDSPAPVQRATKELAKQKLQLITNGEEFPSA